MWNGSRARVFHKFVLFQIALAFTVAILTAPANAVSIKSTDSDSLPNEVTSMSIPMTPENNRWAYDLVNSDEVNASGINGAGTRIALLDNGIDMRDSRIASKVIGRFDATHSVSGQYDHGTGTSSIIAADPMPEAGIGGVAPGASILDVRVCLNTQCRNEWIVDGLKWAIDNEADVISMSIAGSGIDAAITQLINDAITQGITVVVAAGNQACAPTYSNGNQTWVRNCTQTTMPRSFPGSLSIPGLITVGAIGRDLTRNSYSNYGSFVDVVAPGTDVATLYPWGPNAYFGGTSAATPMVAGIVALIKQASPNLTPAQIQAVLQATTSDPASSVPNLWESCVRVENLWECSGLSPARWPSRFYTGAGVVDALSAVQMAQALTINPYASGLTATSADSSLSLDWSTASLGIAPYSIYVDGNKVAETELSQFTISGLTNDTQYSLQVFSSDLFRTEPILATPSSAVSIAAPIAYLILSTANSLLFHTQQQAPTATGVVLFDNGDRAPCRQTIGDTFITCDYIMQSSLITGRFRFVDEFGKLGSLSSAITWSNSYLAAPTEIQLDVVSRTQVSASWNPVELATSYCYYDAGQGAWIPTSQTSVQILGVRPGLPQTFTVFASDGSCRATGRHSPTYWYLPFSAPLSAPVDLAVQEINEVGLRISFTAPVGVDSYAVYRSDGKNWITGNSDSFIVDVFSNTDQGRNFTYRITAIETETYGSQYGDVSSGLSVSVPRKVSGAPKVDTGTVVVQTPVQTSVVVTATPTIAAKKTFTAKYLAANVGVTLKSKKAIVSISVSKTSKKVCAKFGSKLKTLKAGNCVVTFTVQEPKPKKGNKPKATTTTKTLIVK
jgi:hypothetical protein